MSNSESKDISRSVWFVHENNTLYLLPVQSSETNWYKNMLNNSTIKISINGTQITKNAKPISDSNKVKDIVDKFRSKYRGQEILYIIRCRCRGCSAARINFSSSKIIIYGQAVRGTGSRIDSLDDGIGGPRRWFSWGCSDRLLFWGDDNGGEGWCVDGERVRFSG